MPKAQQTGYIILEKDQRRGSSLYSLRLFLSSSSKYFTFEYKEDKEMVRQGYLTVEKGSITVNGVSLTVCDSTLNSFRVAIIPYTFEHTNFCDIQVGTTVNLEFDIIGKYIARLQQF